MNEIEKEVWDTVISYTELIIKGKVNEYLEFVDDNYSGWNNIEPLPIDKQSIINELGSITRQKQDNDYKIVPTKLNIHKEVAVVHYYLIVKVDEDKKNKNCKSKHYTDVLIKKKGKWVLIADHFGIIENGKK